MQVLQNDDDVPTMNETRAAFGRLFRVALDLIDVGSWHKADIPTGSTDVRFWG